MCMDISNGIDSFIAERNNEKNSVKQLKALRLLSLAKGFTNCCWIVDIEILSVIP